QTSVYGRGHRGGGLGIGPPVTPPVVKQLLIANAVVFAVQTLLARSVPIDALFAVRPVAVWQGLQLWQPFTYMWLHGGFGFIKDYPAEKYYRDVKLCTIGEGTSEIQRLVIARQLLKD
ncbi:MAG: hypothetical protein L0212_11935, partial [Acidobacteria bacterium]|nr:hypothetical protein [Acidobacteriota bacterium]